LERRPDHQVFLRGGALRDEERERDQGVVREARRPVFAVEEAAASKRFEEEEGADPLVPVAEGVVFDDEIQQVGGTRLRGRVEVSPPNVCSTAPGMPAKASPRSCPRRRRAPT